MQSLQEGFEKQGQPVNFGTMAHDHEMYLSLADTAMELRDEASIKKYAPLLEGLAKRDNHKLYLAIAHRAQGVALHLTGKPAEAETRLTQSLALFKELGARWQTARTLFELGELNAAQPRKKTKAREFFSQALAIFDEVQALPYADRTRARLDSLA